MHKVPYVFPIVGGRTTEHLNGNIEALGLELEAVVPFDLGFPLNSFLRGKVKDVSNKPTATDHFGNALFVKLDHPELVQPIKPGHKVAAKGAE
jgi:hypothetical protein